MIIRAEIKRLFRWLADRGVTAIVTGESGQGEITRHGLEEYVADFVVVLNHLVSDETATRRLRIVKYRGSAHGTNEVLLPHRREGRLGAADQRPGPSSLGADEAGALGPERPRRDVRRRGRLPGKQRAHQRHRRHRQVQPRRDLRRGAAAGAARSRSTSPSRSRRSRSCATCAPSASICSSGWTRACSASTPSGRRTAASRCTSSA